MCLDAQYTCIIFQHGPTTLNTSSICYFFSNCALSTVAAHIQTRTNLFFVFVNLESTKFVYCCHCCNMSHNYYTYSEWSVGSFLSSVSDTSWRDKINLA